MGTTVADMGDAVFDRVVTEMLSATEQFRHGNQLLIPHHTHLISAVAR